jgi:Na+/proline symporter
MCWGVKEMNLEDGQDDIGQRRKKLYWLLSAVSSAVFLLFVFLLMMVPREDTPTELVTPLWMLSAAGIMLVVSLVIGVWRPLTSQAPVASAPSGSIVAVLLVLELGVCIFGVISILRTMLRWGQ